MNLVVRRRLAAGALLASSALVAGVLLAPSSNAANGGLSVSPSGALNTDAAKPLTFTGTDTDFEFGSTETFARVGGGTPFTVTTARNTPPTGPDNTGTTTVNFTDMGDGLGNDGPADAGVYNVTSVGTQEPGGLGIIGGGGTDNCGSCFTVLSPGAVTFTSISPTSLRPGNTGKNITITGNNFERGTTVSFLLPDGSVDPLITANAAPTSDDTNSGTVTTAGITTRVQLLRRAKVDSAATPGARGMRITNLDGNSVTCTACFFVSGPALSGISPTSGVNDPGTAGCRPATTPLCTVTMNGPNVTPNGVPRLEFTGNPGSSTRDALSLDPVSHTTSNGTSISGDFDLLNAAPGAYQAVVRDAATGITNACESPCPAFTVIQSTEPPTVTSLDDPNRTGSQHDQAAGTTKIFDVNGTNFSKGVAIKVLGAGTTTAATGVTVTGVQFVSRTLARATIVTASTATAADYDVTATLTDGSTSAACAKCYTVTAATPTPSASSTASSTASACPSGSASPSSTASPVGTATPSASATSSTTASPTASSSATALPVPLFAAATPSATPTATISPSASASASSTTSCGTPLGIAVSPKDIVPNQASTVFVHGSPNTQVDVYAYSRPNTTYSIVRSGKTDSQGNISWPVTPGGNTRLYAHYTNGSTTTAANDSPTTVITVHTSLSLSAYRDGARKYHFQGTNLPRRPGQLITLYRYATGPNLDQYCVPTAESDTTTKSDGSCHAVIASQAKTGSNDQWRIDRTFTGDGKFYFVVRTSTNVNNGRGHSNQRLTIIH